MTTTGMRTSGLPWWPAERSAPAGEREPLTRARIVETALRLIDREGLDALSMRRLGDELGAGTTSVYWHVANKDQLLDLVLDQVLGEILAEVEPTEDWRELLRRSAHAMRRVLVRHRHVVSLLGERMGMGPSALDGLDALLGGLLRAGFDGRLAVLTCQTVLNFASGWAVFECRTPSGPQAQGRSLAEMDAVVGDMMAQLPSDRYPALAAVGPLFGQIGWEEQFAFGLERLLDGIADHREHLPER